MTMLFLVISTPRPERPSEWAAARRKSWDWWEPLEEKGIVKWYYARVGRGAVALFDVDSHEQLHELLNGWSELIPVSLDVYPLIDIAASKKFLASQLAAKAAPATRKQR
jgi:muconolactone delta-isomerase